MEERESRFDGARIWSESRCIREETERSDIYIFEFPSFLSSEAMDLPYSSFSLRGGGHDQENNLRGNILFEGMNPHLFAQEVFQFQGSGEGIGFIAHRSQSDQTCQFTSLRIDNCNAVDIPFFCFPIEPIPFKFPSTTTPFFTPTPLKTPFGGGTICDETIIISGRSGDYCSCPACGKRRLPFSTGKRFLQDGIRRRTAEETSHETFGFDEKEFLIYLCQTVYEEFHYLINECCLFWIRRGYFSVFYNLQQDL